MKRNLLVTLAILMLVFVVSCDAETIMGIGNKMNGISLPIADVNLPVIEDTKEDISTVCNADFMEDDPEVFLEKVNSLVENITKASENTETERAIKETLGKRATVVPEQMDTVKTLITGITSMFPEKVDSYFEGNVPVEIQTSLDDVLDVIDEIFDDEKTVSDVVSFQIVSASIIEVATELEVADPLSNMEELLNAAAHEANEDLNGFMENQAITSVIDKLSTMLYINDCQIELTTLLSLFI